MQGASVDRGRAVVGDWRVQCRVSVNRDRQTDRQRCGSTDAFRGTSTTRFEYTNQSPLSRYRCLSVCLSLCLSVCACACGEKAEANAASCINTSALVWRHAAHRLYEGGACVRRGAVHWLRATRWLQMHHYTHTCVCVVVAELLGRIASIAHDAVCCYRRSSVVSVCLSVCLSDGHVREPGKKRLNRSRCRLGAVSGGTKEPCIRWRVEIPMGRGVILVIVRPVEKHWESLLRCRQPKGSFSPQYRLATS